MESVSEYINQDSYYEVDIVSIEDIQDKFKPNFLKMDCEGCEFKIIQNANLSSFDEILFEHHSKIANYDYKILMDKLTEQGFKIKNSTVFDESFEDLGLIYAYK